MVSKGDIALVRSLASKKGRAEHGLFVVEGRKMVAEALASGFVVRRIFATGEFSSVERAQIVSPRELERMSALRTPQGILALVELPPLPAARLPQGLTLALDGVQDPGNLGTIIRTADWFGIRQVVCSPDCVDRFNPKVVQATMGALFRVDVIYCPLPEYLAKAEKAGVEVLGTFLEGEPLYGATISRPDRALIVLGSEGRGISEDAAAHISRKILIPPYPASGSGAESLNVATAAAVVISELRRRATMV